MYVCVCNALNERKVREALSHRADSVAQIYKHHGCAPKCGKCVPTMRDMVREGSGRRLPEPLPSA